MNYYWLFSHPFTPAKSEGSPAGSFIAVLPNIIFWAALAFFGFRYLKKKL